MSEPFITPYNGFQRSVVKKFKKPSLTDQSFKQECDIGYIIESCLRTGQVPQGPSASYLDCTSVSDYQTAMQVVAQCKSDFECLPSKIRDEFKNVENYLEYIGNPSNLKDCYERGLIDPSSVTEDVLKQLYPERYNVVSATAATPAEPVNSSSGVAVGTVPQTVQTQATQDPEPS